jgi:hypothetical protein
VILTSSGRPAWTLTKAEAKAVEVSLAHPVEGGLLAAAAAVGNPVVVFAPSLGKVWGARP